MTTDHPAIGVIGPGAIADVHARALSEIGVQVHAAAGPEQADLDEFCHTHRVEAVYSDHRELLADPAVDAVIVAAPSALHAPVTLDAIAAGKHVLCEIPIAIGLDDAEAVAHAADDAGLVVAIAHTLRFWEPHRELVRRLAEADGPALHALSRSFMLRQTNVGWTGKVRSWTDSVLWHHGSHAVDSTLWFLGAPDVDVRGTCGRVWEGSGAPMDVSAVMTTGDGRLGNVSLSYHSRAAKSDFLVVTEGATYEISDGRLLRDDEVVLDVGDTATVQRRAVVAQDRDFLAAVAGRSVSAFSARDALPTARVLQAVENAARTDGQTSQEA